MRIVIATAVYYPQINGVAVFSHNLACGLAKRGHEVLVICPSTTGKNYTKTQDGVRVCYLKSVDAKVYPDQIHEVPEKKQVGRVKLPQLFYRHGLRVSVFPFREVRQILDEFKPDVVHVQVSDPIGLSVVGYARRHDIPVVTTEHNQPEVLTDSLKMPSVVKKGANVVLSTYFRNRQSKSDFVTMPTERAIRGLLKDMRRDLGVPVAAVSNGVDLTCFKPGKAPKAVYEKYGVAPDRPVVLYVGRLDPEKQVGLVIEAFNRARTELAKTGVDPLLMIVGDGTDKARLEGLSLKLGLTGSVVLLGKVLPPDLYEIYQMGQIFVTASPIETQGIVLIEAAACGMPLIAVDKGAVAEVCQDGVNGVLCEAGDTRAIANAMINILADKKTREKFAQASLKIAAEHDLERTLDKFENIYRQVVKDS
ncbi:glycosyltransferase [Candidatus Saccharibacteria bacterium]|nr:glycosyltransferase [Candidatus Saccharibacteria bacterium]